MGDQDIAEDSCYSYDLIGSSNDQQDEIELPQEIIESFARFLVPEIRKYYESEQGQREFKEWEERQKIQNNE